MQIPTSNLFLSTGGGWNQNIQSEFFTSFHKNQETRGILLLFSSPFHAIKGDLFQHLKRDT